jgi:primosomal protein N' (replication factor Y)
LHYWVELNIGTELNNFFLFPQNLSYSRNTQRMPFFAEVILPLSLAKTFTYSVSEAEYNYINKGMRVAVPFGKSKVYTALVIDTHQNQPILYDAKEIHQILDEKPIVTDVQIAHWKWISSYYMCAIGDVYRGAMPSGLLLESETLISQKTDVFVDESALSDDEFLIYQARQEHIGSSGRNAGKL